MKFVKGVHPEQPEISYGWLMKIADVDSIPVEPVSIATAGSMARVTGRTVEECIEHLMAAKVTECHYYIEKNGCLYMQQCGTIVTACTEVGEVIEADTFPVVAKYTKDDISITKWPDGNHYYAKVGPHSIDNIKCNTAADAEAEAKKLLRKLNRRKK